MSLIHDFFQGAAAVRGWSTKAQHAILLEYILGGPEYDLFHDFTIEIAEQHGVPREEILGDVASHMGWSDRILVDVMLDFIDSCCDTNDFEGAILELVDAEHAAAPDPNFGTPRQAPTAPRPAPTPATPVALPAALPPAFKSVVARPKRPIAAGRRIEIWL